MIFNSHLVIETLSVIESRFCLGKRLVLVCLYVDAADVAAQVKTNYLVYSYSCVLLLRKKKFGFAGSSWRPVPDITFVFGGTLNLSQLQLQHST